MVNITAATNFGVRGVTNNLTAGGGDTLSDIANSIKVTSNSATLNLNQTGTTNALTTENAHFTLNFIRGSGNNVTVEKLNSSNTTYHINTAAGGANSNPGIVRHTNDRIIKAVGTGARWVYGNSDEALTTRWVINGLTVIGYGEAGSANNAVFHTGGASFNSVYNGLVLAGTTTAELKSAGLFYLFTPAPAASTAQVDAAYNANFGYSIRNIHQSLSLGNTPADSAASADISVLYVEPQLQDVVAPGSVNGDGTTSVRQSSWQQNRNSSIIMVNPNYGGSTNDLVMLFHNSGNTPDSLNRASEMRHFVGYNPRFTTLLGEEITVATKVQFFGQQRTDGVTETAGLMEVREIPVTWANELPLPITNSEMAVTGTGDRGFWIQDNRSFYDAKGSVASRNPTDPAVNSDLRFGPTRSHTAYMRNWQFDFVFEYALPAVGTPTVLDDALRHTGDNLAGADLVDFLNGRAEDGAPLSGVNDLADVYASIRRVWYDATNANTQGAIPITTGGSTLTFATNTAIANSGNSSYDGNLTTIGGVNTGYSLSGSITTFDFGGNSVTWAGQAFPDGISVDGGSHSDLGDMTGVNWNAGDSAGGTSVTIDLNENADITVEAESIVGIHTGVDLVVTNLGTGTVTVNNIRNGFIAANNVLISAQATVSNRSTSITQVVTIWDAPAGVVTSDVPLATFTGLADIVFTIPLTSTNLRVVWVDESFEPFLEDFTRADGLTTIAITRTATANAAPADTTIGLSAIIIALNASNMVTYNITNADATLGGAETNRLFEAVKTAAGFSLTVARQNRIDQINHPDALRTQMPLGTFQLGNNAAAAQQQVTGIRNQNTDLLDPDTQITILTGSIRTVIVFPSTGLALGDVVGALEVQTIELRDVVDEELKVGVLTNIGRP